MKAPSLSPPVLFEERATHLMFTQLSTLGIFNGSQNLRSLNDWKTAIGMTPWYGRWLSESLRILEERNCITTTADSISPLSAVIADGKNAWLAWDEWKGQWLDDEQLGSRIRLLDATMRALPDILTGRLAATDVMFPNGSLEQVAAIYRNNPVCDYFNEQLAAQLIGYLHGRVGSGQGHRVIEFGAGTGGTSAAVLEALRTRQARIEEYCYTDISGAFLKHADAQFGAANPYLRTMNVDVEVPLDRQNVPLGSFDVAIAGNVLHATRNIRQAVRNIKTALKYDGLLLLGELSTKSLFTHLTFGLLRGWWLYEDEPLRIPGSPVLHSDVWARVLKAEGFEHIAFPARGDHDLGQQIVVARSNGIVRMGRDAPRDTGLELRPMQRIRQGSENALGMETRDASEESSRPTSSLAGGAGQPEAERLNRCVRRCLSEVLKISEREIDDRVGFAEYGVDSIVAVGLANQVGRECGTILPTTAIFDYNSVELLTQHLSEKSSFPRAEQAEMKRPQSVGANRAPDVAAASRVVQPRVSLGPRRQPAMPEHRPSRRKSVHGANAQEAPPGSYLRAVLERPGAIEDIRIVSTIAEPIEKHEVRIAVHAFSLNFADLLCVKGLYPSMPAYPFTPGMEVAGVVSEIGRQVTSVGVGDAVVAITAGLFGGHATLVKCTESQIWRKPENLSFEEACSLPAAAITMLDAFRKAQLQPNDRILIQTATGGTGLIAVQLAQHFGGEIFATAGSQSKIDHLEALGVPHRINYRERDFEEEVKRLTKGRGVDVVINTLGGEAIQKGLNCLAPGGRYIEIAMTALKSAKSIDLSRLSDNQSFYSINVNRLFDSKPQFLRDCGNELADYVSREIIRPTVAVVVPFEQLHSAYRKLDNRENIGKIVVSVPNAARFGAANTGTFSTRSAAAPIDENAIALVGLSGRFPHAENIDQLWQHLAQGHDLTEDTSRWGPSDLLDGEPATPNSNRTRGGFLADIKRFDPWFFNISRAEAVHMDPQQRLFLEEAWKALEDAGYAGAGVEGSRCGVYVGCSSSDYPHLFGPNPPAQAFWGNASSVIPARIAYHLNLQGPTVAIDTACSSSLVALHLACQGLRLKEMDMAICGGVFIQTTPRFYRLAQRAGMLSSRGRCFSFDDRADGFVPCEAVGVAILKRLADAERDGDQIHCVIRGSGINHNGKSAGITAPSARSQARLARQVYESSKVHPDRIQMLEAQGTGTRLGDPIEHEALAHAFRKDTARKSFCALGSIKTNLGHAGTAAGILGVIKVALSLRHKQIPPSLHFEGANSEIDFSESPFFLNTALRHWDVGENERRCAAVNAFGFSGTNAHVVIEEAPPLTAERAPSVAYLIALSARSSEQLTKQAEQLCRFVQQTPDIDLGDVSFTLLMGRRHFAHRLAVVTRTRQEFIDLVSRWLSGMHVPQIHLSTPAEGQRREHQALRAFGNDCMDTSRRSADERVVTEQLAVIADLYTRGYELSFERLFSSGTYRRISLPTYPFAREVCWVESQESTEPVEAETAMRGGDAGALPVPPIRAVVARRFTRQWVAKEPAATGGKSDLHYVVLAEPPGNAEQAVDRANAEQIHQRCWQESTREYLATRLHESIVRIVVSGRSTPQHRLDEYIYQLRAIIGEIRSRAEATPAFVQLVVPRGCDEAIVLAAGSVIWAAASEMTNLTSQLILVDAAEPVASLLRKLQENAKALEDKEIAYENGQRVVVELREMDDGADTLERPWSDTGVYLITQGDLSVVSVVTREIAKHAPGATILLVGDGKRPTALKELLQEVESAGLRMELLEADLTDATAVSALLRSIQVSHSPLTGIIHCGSGNLVQTALGKSSDSSSDPIAWDIFAANHLDFASRGLFLDFFLVITPSERRTDTPGLVANIALDRFAMDRNLRVARGECAGRSLSVGWPLWDATRCRDEEGDMRGVKDELRASVTIEALYRAYSSGLPQVAISLDCGVPIESRPPAEERAPAQMRQSLHAFRTALSRIVAELTGVPLADVDIQSSFTTYGFDSIRLAELGESLRDKHGLESSLRTFFEYPSIVSISEYFAQTQPDRLMGAQSRIDVPSSEEGRPSVSHSKRTHATVGSPTL